MLSGQLNSFLRLFEVRARHHELDASGLDSSLEDVFEVIIVCFPTVVYPSENGIAEVDTDLCPSIQLQALLLATFHEAVMHADLRLRIEVGSLVGRQCAHGQMVLERLHAQPLVLLLLRPWSELLTSVGDIFQS